MDAFRHDVRVIGGSPDGSTNASRLVELSVNAILPRKRQHSRSRTGNARPATLPLWNESVAHAAGCPPTLSAPTREGQAPAQFECAALLGPKHFSWPACRAAKPSAHALAMAPRSLFRAQAALRLPLPSSSSSSLLPVGGVHGKAPYSPARFLNAVHCAHSVRHMPRAFRAEPTCRHSNHPMAPSV